jgi:hypothetical protein
VQGVANAQDKLLAFGIQMDERFARRCMTQDVA